MKNQPNIPANEHLAVYFQPHSTVPRIFTFVHWDTPEELERGLQHARDQAMINSNAVAANWEKTYGEEWKQAWQACFGHGFDELVELQQAMQLMTWEEFATAERQALIGTSTLRVISVEQYYDALEVLPPLTMGSNTLGSWFLMSEFYIDTYTSMYLKAKVNGEVVAGTRLVDANDSTTWITVGELKSKVQEG